MRLHFLLTKNTETVPFDYQHLLIGVFHKWMGWNQIHDEISLYSLSWLQGSKISESGFDFPNGAKWFVSFWNEETGKQLVMNAMKMPEVFCGMKVSEIQIQESPLFGSKERFTVSSPVFIRKYTESKKPDHLVFNNIEADKYLTDTLKKKLKTANLNYNVNVSFDKTYLKAKTKVVNIKGIKSKANLCPVIVEGDPEAVQFAWNVGIGHCTGSGFGAIY
jgi:CRISPR-associated endoribonuclease Cas6